MVALAWSAGACAPPDTPPALERDLPEGVLEWLAPDTVRAQRLGAGVWHWYVWSVEGPWAIHVVEADMNRCDIALATLRSAERESGGRGHESVTSMVARAGGALAAVNADFFTPEGTALGTEVVDGAVTVARERPTLAWRRDTGPWMGPADIDGDTLRAGWGIPMESGDGVTQAVGGYPELLDAGRRVGDLLVQENPGFAIQRHPRTAVGWDPYGRRLWFVVVDGRQAAHSAGMSLPELVTLLEALGAVDAINLDGGGSSILVIRGRAANRPSDDEGERPVVNALALVRDAEGCAP